jgi:hypothetical protein
VAYISQKRLCRGSTFITKFAGRGMARGTWLARRPIVYQHDDRVRQCSAARHGRPRQHLRACCLQQRRDVGAVSEGALHKHVVAGEQRRAAGGAVAAAERRTAQLS